MFIFHGKGKGAAGHSGDGITKTLHVKCKKDIIFMRWRFGSSLKGAEGM